MADGNAEGAPADIRALRAEFPEWTFGVVWASAASGLDARRVWAMREGALFSAWAAGELAFDLIRQTGGAQIAPKRQRDPGPA